MPYISFGRREFFRGRSLGKAHAARMYQQMMGDWRKLRGLEEEQGFCMLLGERCCTKCPHYYYRRTNGCYKEDD